MQRENYYIILELSVDPPENDLEIIKKTIQDKKIEWSRLRNHPTKGLQIQKFIDMIPDIQMVMLDNDLREKEAAAAAELLQAGRETKISEIDGHIDILMGKGFISKEDVIRLAELHGLAQSDINDRIATRQNAKYARLDQLISLRMGKGYLLEDEVAKIAKKNGLDPEEIRKRIRCPIVKDDKESEDLKIRPLDKSIEKALTDNLKVVGKTSLYDFLGLPETAEITELQEKATRRKKGLSAEGKKDAMVTAGITLAGQCLTIFKTNETRIAYDVSRAIAKLSALDSDINVAAINKKIRHEYFDALTTKAMSYGMDREEAISYIQSFCEKKNYHIEAKPKKKQRVLVNAVASVLLLTLLAGGGMAWYKIHHKSVRQAEYQALITQVDAQNSADQKLLLLRKYVDSHPAGEYSDDAQGRIQKIQQEITTEAFNKIILQADELIQAGHLENSLAILNQYVEKESDPENIKTIRQNIQQVSDLMEKRDFEELSAVALSGDAGQKISIFRKYLQNHPNGKNKDQVQSLISGMSDEYFIYITRQLAVYEKSSQWEDGAGLCESYIELYDNSHSDQLKQVLSVYQENIRQEKIYAALKEKADHLGADYTAALQIFKDYLAAYPKTTITEKITQDIDRLNGLIAIENINQAANRLRENLAGTKGRFVEKNSGVILDTRTGLMWCMTDSTIAQPGACLPYEKGKEYVDSLTSGGFSDWRLPTPEELSGIYETDPAFPASANLSYWTSESYSGYSDGWQIQVTTLSSEDGRHWKKNQKNALECGAVRAVRNP
ncbi:MAG: hypothetical protein COX19_15990 [Desulfobacterales bacterium CG23_combo_of_CG06-09_8_20_14_all_51_8]|nr:MAG: hypothetical protein COX19_15990 [Desulfobacterales bacterium CG23_combo_of_CG06-09_8_20_14_all_51_8]